jgi:hypothetical protein
MYPPSDDALVVICGTPMFENAMVMVQWFSIAQEDRIVVKQ